MDPLTSLITLGNPILRRRSRPVANLADPQLQGHIDQLLTTVEAAHGVGIAAPQLGWSQQIVVVASRPNLRYPHAPAMAPTVLINPWIVAHSPDQAKGWEGCLSVPGVRGQVWRHQTVEVAYLDRWGQPQRQIWSDFVARIVQHELDHLAGHVFLDRVASSADVLSEEDYQAMVIDTFGSAVLQDATNPASS
ncbi:MAG: peptide deformylase [Leptolyngbya sp. LCM1.Bin17]|nr:MAG: peptide deformylase [Leptolyngbya sp. LCM1.Bin17]